MNVWLEQSGSPRGKTSELGPKVQASLELRLHKASQRQLDQAQSHTAARLYA
jgi:hypothetical protein